MIGWLEHPVVKAFFPVPMLAAAAVPIYWFFAPTWRRLEAEALALRQELAAAGKVDYRPLVALTLGALILAMQEYYGSFGAYHELVRPFVLSKVLGGGTAAIVSLTVYDEIGGRVWWALTRIGGYLVPFVVWRFAFPRDDLRDLGLRLAGVRQHAWLYALFVVLMVPLVLVMSYQPDFVAYYPICSTAGRSWVEFVIWESVYVAQFLTLEMFFRGWWVRATRIFGAGAIFCMIVPYCMVHFRKPYLEVCSALIAGVVLGSLSMRTRSIWAGVMVHVTVALLMDVLALERKGQLPSALTAGSSHHVTFLHWRAVIWMVWTVALVVVVVKAIRYAPVLRAAWAARRERKSGG